MNNQPLGWSMPKPHHINGEDYYDINQFAAIVGRHASHVSMLFNKGNKIRKLNGIRIAGKPMICAAEVTEFPFDWRKEEKNED